MMKTRSFLACAFILSLYGCNGDDSSTSYDPIEVKSTSYANFKESDLTPQDLPSGRSNVDSVRAYGDFTQSGTLDLFVATLTYWPPTSPEESTPSILEIWQKQADGSYVKDSSILSTSDGCIHPRKAVVADFNFDAVPDIFLVCHGYDASPFPGEKNQIILSQSDGSFSVEEPSSDIGFFHSGSAADLNGDGYIDIVLTDNFDSDRALVLLNNGDGTFVRESPSRLPTSIQGKNYYSVELVDVDGDDVIDMLLGGHEYEGADTVALINPGDNNFSDATSVTLPEVANEGVVLDFVVTEDSGIRYVWVLRTSGGDGTFYESRVIQRVIWPSLSSSIPLLERGEDWFQWIIPATVNGNDVIVSDSSEVNVSISR